MDNSVFTTIINRLDALEKDKQGMGNQEIMHRLDALEKNGLSNTEISELKDTFNTFTNMFNGKLEDFERAFVDMEEFIDNKLTGLVPFDGVGKDNEVPEVTYDVAEVHDDDDDDDEVDGDFSRPANEAE